MYSPQLTRRECNYYLALKCLYKSLEIAPAILIKLLSLPSVFSMSKLPQKYVAN